MRSQLRNKLRSRAQTFAGWVSFSHPSITEIFARSGVDFIAIDMEHAPISQAEAQRIIAACQSAGIPCLPRPGACNTETIKPLLDSGADGIIIPLVSTPQEVDEIIKAVKFSPVGSRSFGVSRAQGYGFDFENYVRDWNASSTIIIQIETAEGVRNIDELLKNEHVDGVMVGPYDLSGSLGVPGQVDHPLVKEAARKVIDACKKSGKSCGTQIIPTDAGSIQAKLDEGYTFVILSSDLFVLWKWAEQVQKTLSGMKGNPDARK